MNISRGPVKSAVKVLIYGPEGVGKTTFAAQMPGAVFIDTEGSTRHMDVARFDTPEDLNDVIMQLDYVLGHPNEISTIVIDTVDWLEKLIFNAVCVEKKIQNIEDMGYGKGYVYAKQKMQELLVMLQDIVDAGVHVCLVCHSMIRKFELPDEMGSYDRYMLKLNEKNIAPLVKEWVDMMLFVNYRTDIVVDSDGKTKKGKGGQKRIMYANHSACWDAKNRFGLPDEMPFEFERVAEIFQDIPKTAPAEPVKAEVTKTDTLPEPEKPKNGRKTVPSERPKAMISEDPEKDQLLAKLWDMMINSQVVDHMALQAVVADKGYYDVNVPVNEYDREFIEGCLIEAWDSTVRGLCISKQNDLPF